MHTYQVFLDGRNTGETVTSSSYVDAYFDIASTHCLTYKNQVDLKEIQTDNE